MDDRFDGFSKGVGKMHIDCFSQVSEHLASTAIIGLETYKNFSGTKDSCDQGVEKRQMNRVVSFCDDVDVHFYDDEGNGCRYVSNVNQIHERMRTAWHLQGQVCDRAQIFELRRRQHEQFDRISCGFDGPVDSLVRCTDEHDLVDDNPSWCSKSMLPFMQITLGCHV